MNLADVTNPTGGAWIDEHTIVFASYLSTLLRVSDDGGTPQPLTRFEPGETAHVSPRPLPGGKVVLFSTASTRMSAIAVQRIDTGARHDIIQTPGPGAPDYVGPGYVIYRAGRQSDGGVVRHRAEPDGRADRGGAGRAPVQRVRDRIARLRVRQTACGSTGAIGVGLARRDRAVRGRPSPLLQPAAAVSRWTARRRRCHREQHAGVAVQSHSGHLFPLHLRRRQPARRVGARRETAGVHVEPRRREADFLEAR